jgi:hypothetical protein
MVDVRRRVIGQAKSHSALRRTLVMAVSSAIFLALTPGVSTPASAANALGCPAAASAYPHGTGTQADPYTIDDSTHLQRLWERPQDWDDSFVLTAAIDMRVNGSPCEWSAGIGTLSTPFVGALNGDDTQIIGLMIRAADVGDGDDTAIAGLFGVVGQAGVVKNLLIDRISVQAESDDSEVYAGAVAGIVYGTLDDVQITNGDLRSDQLSGRGVAITAVAGGAAGRTMPTSVVSDLSYSGFISARSIGTSIAGGVIGLHQSSTTAIGLTGPPTGYPLTVSGWVGYGGGVIGQAEGSVTDATSGASVDIQAQSHGAGPLALGIGGGIVGRAVGPHLLSGATSAGGATVAAERAIAGGIAGISEFDIEEAFADGQASATSNDDTETALAGGLVGRLAPGVSVTDSYSGASATARADFANSEAIAGGLVGDAAAGTSFTNTGARGSASAYGSASALAGGLIGVNAGTITKSYAVTSLTSYKGPGSSPVIGDMGAFIGRNTGNATLSFWQEGYAESGVGPGSAPLTDLTMLTYEQAQDPATYADEGWDIVSNKDLSHVWNWCINVNIGYPLNSFAFPQDACRAITPLQQGVMPWKYVAMTPTPAYTALNFPGSPSMTYSISPAQLPAGLTFDTSTGSISGTPTADADYVTFTVTGRDSNSGLSAEAVISLGVQNPTLWPETQTVTGNVDDSIAPTTRFQAGYFAGRPSYTIVPDLPEGLVLDSVTGIISGTPTEGWPRTTHTITATSGLQTATSLVTLTVTPKQPPIPPAPIPSSAPTSATAVPGDASALVSWRAPLASGSYPVTQYLVTSLPSGLTCIASSTSCAVTGLTNGTAYSFTVKALSGAGWSPASAPSPPVTPRAASKSSITILGTRDGRRISILGISIGLNPLARLHPWIRVSGQANFTRGSAIIPVGADGSFEWSRRSSKRTFVYVATLKGETRSNAVLIPTG